MTELLEGVSAGDEIGFARNLDHRAHLAVGVDVGVDQPFGGLALGFRSGLGDSLLAEEFRRGFEVAAGFLKGFFAFDDAGASAGAEFGDGFGVNHISYQLSAFRCQAVITRVFSSSPPIGTTLTASARLAASVFSRSSRPSLIASAISRVIISIDLTASSLAGMP